jgi:hypothetical protein
MRFTGLSAGWEIRTEGFWNPTYRLREIARGVDIASYTARWHGAEGLIQISNGPQFTWKVTGMFTGKYAVSDSAGRVLLRVHLGLESRKMRWSDWARTQGTVEVEAGPYDEKIVNACMVLAWFLVLLNRDHDGSSTSTNIAMMG